MGIQFKNVDESNVLAVIRLYRSANILSWIPSCLVNREVCLVAVQVNGLAIKQVPDNLSTRAVRSAAILENHQALWAIPSSLIDYELLDAAFESLVIQCKKARYINY